MGGIFAFLASIPQRLKPAALLRLVVNPKLLAFIGQERVDFVDRIVNNTIMVKRRQRECQNQPTVGDTAEYLKTRFCAEPFRTLETTHTGLAFVCCPVWLPTPIGTLDDDPEAMWSGPVAQDIRASIIDGSFRHCDHRHCPAITNRALDDRSWPEPQAIIAAYASAEPPKLPTNVNLSHDKSCNLSCPSCRGDLYLAKKSKQVELDALTERFVLPLLKNAETVMVTGSGDPFASNHFRSVIKRLTPEAYPKLRLNLITNGQLCDARAWRDLGLADRVDNVHVSVDAATSDTYKFVRRLGNFDRLRANLAFLKDQREKGEIQTLEFSMVVQSRNFREMAGLVEMAREYSADAVHFQMIRQRDLFSAAEYELAFIGDPAHPDFAAFVDAVGSPLLREEQGALRIEMGNVLGYVERANVPVAA